MTTIYTKQELQGLEKKYNEFLQVRQNAINVVKKYIDRFQHEVTNDPSNILVVKDLQHGLEVLKKGKSRIEREGIDGIANDIKEYPTSTERPGLGLSRGFGEFLWQGEDWQNEIMDAVDKIEDYYSDM